MKKKSALVIVSIGIIFTLVFFLQRSRLIQGAKSFTGTISVPTLSINSSTTNSTLSVISSTPPVPKLNIIQNDREKTNIIREYMESQNVPIDFFGKITDQDGNPVSGVKVQIKVRHWIVITPAAFGADAKMIPVATETDLSGCFEIHNVTGDGFDVESIQKAGYALSPKTPNGFDPNNGSLNNPVIIKMWKLGDKEQLVTGEKFWGIIPDGRVYTIDLLKGIKAESADAAGDFRIAVSRPAGVSRQDRYDWSFQIMPIEGGIIETEDDFMYQAPERDYASKYDFHLNASETPWTYRIKKKFYTEARGHFARIDIEVFAHYQDQGVLNISWAINPTGSRNLQP